MANPYFMFWAYGIGMRNDLDMGEPISDLQQTPNRIVLDSRALGGRYMRTNLTAGLQIRILDERFTAREKWRKLQRMINHLEQGYFVGFAVDVSNAWGAAIRTATRGSSTVEIEAANWFEAWSTGGAALTPAIGDEIVLETGPWKGLREYFKITNVVGTGTPPSFYTLTLDHPIRGEYDDTGIVRNSDFFPYLRLPQGAVGNPGLLSHDHRISFTLDIPLDLIVSYNDIVADQPNDGISIATGTDDNPTPDGRKWSADAFFSTKAADAPAPDRVLGGSAAGG